MFKKLRSGEIFFPLNLSPLVCVCVCPFLKKERKKELENSHSGYLCLHLLCLDSPGIMLLIFNKSSGHVPLQILSIEDGTVLKSFHHLIHRNKKVDFIEQFNEKLLVKQENENLQILDVSTSINSIY